MNLRKNGFYFMIIAIISELILPFVLGYFVADFNQIVNVISKFGETEGFVNIVFKIWEITNGILFFMAIPAFFTRFSNTSKKLAKYLSISIGVFSLGDCILTGLFDNSMLNFKIINIGKLIHGSASFMAFVAIIIGILILGRLYSLEKNKKMVNITIINFILVGIFMVLFAVSKFEFFYIIAGRYRGLWQKLSLLFTFLPFFIVAVNGVVDKTLIRNN
ncbi:DUF998 domain-containing protein [Miniphocaeibacter halophilus]|uniref:DUF998 domain-containing protein n=1 Tax=Miniphocaeibacter halophilus TaxID=2931922 RepID=A0AC61MN17_9FIRM|nr:DUF998 domain-containing protein [Miniphocaeibacter halophilus]QQK06999.1 DUF998 domain-containing protein [Miniphocaeibacter halophilus]